MSSGKHIGIALAILVAGCAKGGMDTSIEGKPVDAAGPPPIDGCGETVTL